MADEVAVMYLGRVVESGAIEQVLESLHPAPLDCSSPYLRWVTKPTDGWLPYRAASPILSQG